MTNLTINCGSAQDQFFTGGFPYSIANPPAGTPATLRFSSSGPGAFSYRIPVSEPGPFVVSLTFVEPTVTGPGQRVFSLRINEQVAIDRIDLFSLAGALKPVYRSFLAYPAEGALNLQFLTILRSSVVSQIVIIPFAQYVVFQEPERIQVTGAIPGMWTPSGYLIPRPAQVTDPTLAIVYQNVEVYQNGMRLRQGPDYSIAAAMFQLQIFPGSGQPWPTSDQILVDYTAILPLPSPGE